MRMSRLRVGYKTNIVELPSRSWTCCNVTLKLNSKALSARWPLFGKSEVVRLEAQKDFKMIHKLSFRRF